MNKKNRTTRSLHLERLFQPKKICVKRSKIHRWGVFAKKSIKKYEILEESPYFAVPIEEINHATSCMTYSYVFDDKFYIIGMGNCGLYNHSFDSNVDYEIDKVNEVMRHYATRDIDEGEELTLNYGEENAKYFDNGNK
jgi:SET domain-containing protein